MTEEKVNQKGREEKRVEEARRGKEEKNLRGKGETNSERGK